MKKSIIKYCLSILFLFVSLNGQTKDTVDIKAMVKEQILAAQKNAQSQNNRKFVPAKLSIDTPADSKIYEKESGFIDTIPYIKLGVLFSASLIAAVFVLKRRLKLKKIENRMSLKNNINAIREEQLVKDIDPRLKSIRKRLCLTSNFLNKPEKEVILAAKKLNVAKEELLLASRLNNFRVNDKMEVTV